MKIAIVFNRESQRVINLFGVPNQEKYGEKAIQRIENALKKGGHQVKSFEGDKDLIDKLEEFMPRVVKGERPGMVFNLSYGIQGQARYTHVPGMLEMIGMPYVGSNPLAHSLALDKVVSKMIFVQNGLPTPDFAVLDGPGFAMPNLKFPLIVKPKNEAVSFGIRIVNNEGELREGAGAIFEQFGQAVLVEQYIAGREVNVGLLGNGTPDLLPPAEIVFGEGGPQIYTYEDKTRKSGREVKVVCPAPIGEALTKKAQQIALGAFNALGCYDCARVDMRLDKDGNLYILEINSLPSLGEHGSYVQGALEAGLDFPALVNRLVEVASARYFGTPNPPELTSKTTNPADTAFAYLTGRRDQIESKLHNWCNLASRTLDPIGTRTAFSKLDETLTEIGLKSVPDYSNDFDVRVWATPARFEGGTLLVGHLDVPLDFNAAHQPFRRDPEFLYGEGIGSSRAPLVMTEYILRALKSARLLKKTPVGVLYYADEGAHCSRSASRIRKAAAKAKQVIVLRPGNPGDLMITQRRGQRKYQLVLDGKSARLGQAMKVNVLARTFELLQALSALSSKKDRIAVAPSNVQTKAFPGLLPHRVEIMMLVSYLDEARADDIEQKMRAALAKGGLQWRLEKIADRPPMPERRANAELSKKLAEAAQKWEIPFATESSLWPSVAGLAPADTAVICGAGPVARDLYTPQECVERISLVQRALLLTQFLIAEVKNNA